MQPSPRLEKIVDNSTDQVSHTCAEPDGASGCTPFTGYVSPQSNEMQDVLPELANHVDSDSDAVQELEANSRGLYLIGARSVGSTEGGGPLFGITTGLRVHQSYAVLRIATVTHWAFVSPTAWCCQTSSDPGQDFEELSLDKSISNEVLPPVSLTKIPRLPAAPLTGQQVDLIKEIMSKVEIAVPSEAELEELDRRIRKMC
eukprot:gnl/TRDRNA2_/TRDRNA2_58474_c0_seq1.p1 gnl/TRDRNA2_/TRDRNA2_58474_c0~~gnl/TRDRNA2_/TRDRNA2_58474_c0_seq1.p1  ORF type:complete len:236 (-),score=13.54 gnl/TRDRNA2_/TRDRNA2_58474_c0_seq1:203-805(-)